MNFKEVLDIFKIPILFLSLLLEKLVVVIRFAYLFCFHRFSISEMYNRLFIILHPYEF